MRATAVLIPLLTLGAAPPSGTSVSPGLPMQARVVSPFPSDCRTPQLADTDRRLTPRKLGELPPAKAYQAVLRAGPDGCPNPLLVSERIGWSRVQPKK